MIFISFCNTNFTFSHQFWNARLFLYHCPKSPFAAYFNIPCLFLHFSFAMDEEDLLFLAFLDEEEHRRQTRTWVREPLLRRQEDGEFHQMVMEKNNPDFFYGAYRMSPQRFEELMTIVRPHLSKQDTNYRKALCADERMAITLRWDCIPWV